MELRRLLEVVGAEVVFDSSVLMAGAVSAADVRRQLVRWVKAGKLVQLRRGLYALCAPYRRALPHPFVVANRLVRGSYVSCESALSHHGLIPEAVLTVTSVSGRRPGRFDTPLGAYLFRHVKPQTLFGYRQERLGGGQEAFVACPEKALLDLVRLTPGGAAPGYLRELRLQNLDVLDAEVLDDLVQRLGSPKAGRAALAVLELARREREEYHAA